MGSSLDAVTPHLRPHHQYRSCALLRQLPGPWQRIYRVHRGSSPRGGPAEPSRRGPAPPLHNRRVSL